METANQKLLDEAIERAAILERFKAGEVRAILSLLNRDLFPELFLLLSNRIDRISSRGIGASVNQFKTLTDLAKEVGELIRSGTSAAYRKLTADLTELASIEATWKAGSIAAALPVLESGLPIIAVATPTRAVLREAVISHPFDNRLLRDHFNSWSRSTQVKVVGAINDGMQRGYPTEQIVRMVRGTRANGYRDGLLNLQRRHVESITRAAVNHASSSAGEAVSRANRDIVKGKRWSATLDLRTCLRCASLDGKVFPVDKGPRPPAHLGKCRCQMVDVLRSWKELGINLREAPEGTRASMDGQVPRTTTFGEWIKRQSAERQDAVLGPRRAAELRAGRLTLDDFVDEEGRILSLKELAAA